MRLYNFSSGAYPSSGYTCAPRVDPIWGYMTIKKGTEKNTSTRAFGDDILPPWNVPRRWKMNENL